ncbi:alpha/beta hydrolase [Hydrogenophaga palleronii]|uniref:alpha/beta hydrolase n=1 Tax=Hydrogenophaga palleronii TaxID=65655 RepID=UPI000824E2D8|nr:alpha/beta hydrolase [Hydrogenophaga palleronii]
MKPNEDVAAFLKYRLENRLPDYHRMTPAEARQVLTQARLAAKLPPPTVGSTHDMKLELPGRTLSLRHYRPERVPQEQQLPALVFFHGGGWVLGDLDTHDVLCRQLVRGAGCSVLSVDYRLAPEHPFPAAVNDACEATAHLRANARAWGVDPACIVLGGDSAGAALATVAALSICHAASDRKLDAPALAGQLLMYPCVDLTLSSRSQSIQWPGLSVTHDTLKWFRGHYLSAAEQQADWRASPLLSPDLQRLPPTCIVTAGLDPLVDDGFAYARQLGEAGVNVAHRHFPGQIHGFLTMSGVLPSALAALDAVSAELRILFSSVVDTPDA